MAYSYYTAEEVKFLRDLKLKKPDACLKYCQLIVAGMRRWDSGIDEKRINKVAASIIEDLTRWN